MVATDRSGRAIAQARTVCAAEVRTGRLELRHVAAEDLELQPGEPAYDLVFGFRVGALDGRHPEAGRRAFARIRAVLAPGGRVFIDGGDPLQELTAAVRDLDLA